MEKERYKVKVSNDLKSVGVFDLQGNEYVVNEKVVLLNTALTYKHQIEELRSDNNEDDK